jgi:LysM repeat protein
MSDIYEFLKAHKGGAYEDDKVKSFSLLSIYPDIPAAKSPKGNSRIVGDISMENQKIVIDMIVSTAARHGLDYAHIAYALLLCKTESDFNPDAAAGGSTAGGLAQYTVATVKDAENTTQQIVKKDKDGIKHTKEKLVQGQAQKYLGYDLNMTGSRVFDAANGANAIVLSVLMSRVVAQKNNRSASDEGYWQLLYCLHHDGLYNQDKIDSGAWSKDAKGAYSQNIASNIKPLTKMLQSEKVDTTLHLTGSDQAPVAGKDYVLAAVEKSSNNEPSHASPKKDTQPKIKIVKGKTDGQGKTKPINTGIGDEIIMLLLPKNYSDLVMSSKASEIHTVKSGETLSKIAKYNDTSVDAIAKTNHLSDADDIKVGQKLELPPPKQLRHKPANWVLSDILKQIGYLGGNIDAISYARNHTANPKGSTSKSTDKSRNNSVELRTVTPAAVVTKTLKKEPEKHTTDKDNSAKTLKMQTNPFSINKFVNALNNKALSRSVGKCAKYVRLALEAGGGNTKGHPVAAKKYGPTLNQIGFKEVDTNQYTPQKGDVVVFDHHTDAKKAHPYGHIAGFTGTQWVSDFKQRNMNPYRGAPNVPYKIYRYSK